MKAGRKEQQASQPRARISRARGIWKGVELAMKRASHPQSPAKYGGERDRENMSQERLEKIEMQVNDMIASFQAYVIDMLVPGVPLFG
jgi:hypothetical protein